MSRFSIGVLLESFRLPLYEALAQSQKVGAQGVQIYVTRGEITPETMTAEKIKELRHALDANGLAISALCGDLGKPGFQDKSLNAERIEQSKRIMNLAVELGTDVVTTHIGVVPEQECDRYYILQEACDELARYGEEVGAYFAIETGPEPSHVLKKFLDSLSARNLCVNLDPANLAMVIGEDAVTAVHNLKDYIVHTHAKDGVMLKKTNPINIYGSDVEVEELLDCNDYFKEVPLGQGSVDFDRYLAALEEVGYHGFLTIEREVGEDPSADISMAVEFLKKKIER